MLGDGLVRECTKDHNGYDIVGSVGKEEVLGVYDIQKGVCWCCCDIGYRWNVAWCSYLIMCQLC